MTNTTQPTELVARSNRLGADPRNTNYAGGNTSAKGTETDPVTGEHVELLWVKGSGGDLGTLTETGLAVLRLDRMRALVDVYPGVDREDEMVAAFDYCLHGKGGAAPSIDTAMHGLVDAAHVDHLHPDSGIAIATAADGEELTEKIFGDKVVWVPWRRPGFQLGPRHRRDQGRAPRRRSAASSAGTASPPGATPATRPSRTRCGSSRPPRPTSPSTRKPEPFGPALDGYAAAARGRAPGQGRGAGADDPVDRLAGPADGRPLHRQRRRARLPRRAPSTRGSPRSAPAARTTSCARRSSRWCSTCPPTRRSRSRSPGCASCTRRTARTTRRYYDRNADAGLAGDPRRRPARSCWCPASACSASARTSRPPASPASSTSTRST